jgi:hypothetical protein
MQAGSEYGRVLDWGVIFGEIYFLKFPFLASILPHLHNEINRFC